MHQTFAFKLTHLPGTENDVILAIQPVTAKKVRVSEESFKDTLGKDASEDSDSIASINNCV